MEFVVLEERAAEVALVMARLDEQQRRWVSGLLVLILPQDGLRKVAGVAGLDEKTVARGRSELEAGLVGIPNDGRVRKPGGGRCGLHSPGRAAQQNVDSTVLVAADIFLHGPDDEIGNAVAIEIADTRHRAPEQGPILQRRPAIRAAGDFQRVLHRSIGIQCQNVNGTPIRSAGVIVQRSHRDVAEGLVKRSSSA